MGSEPVGFGGCAQSVTATGSIMKQTIVCVYNLGKLDLYTVVAVDDSDWLSNIILSHVRGDFPCCFWSYE